MTLAIIVTVGVLLVGLIVILQRRSSRSGPLPRDVDRRGPAAEGTHQGRSPGADGGGHSHYGGG